MPYRKYARRRYARRGRARKARMGPGGYDYNNLARKAMSGVKFLKSLINVEKKVLDLDGTTPQTISNSGQVQWLSSIGTGTGFNQRTGMVVKASSFAIRGTIEVNTSATSPTQMRCIIFINKSLNQGATPAVADVIQSNGISTFAGPYMPYQLDNVGDFTVLYDKKFTVDNVQRSQANVNFRCKLGHHIRWSTSGDTITSTESGHLFMLLISDQSTNAPTFSWYSRLRFIDN